MIPLNPGAYEKDINPNAGGYRKPLAWLPLLIAKPGTAGTWMVLNNVRLLTSYTERVKDTLVLEYNTLNAPLAVGAGPQLSEVELVAASATNETLIFELVTFVKTQRYLVNVFRLAPVTITSALAASETLEK